MNKKQEKRIRLKAKIRAKIFGTSSRPRLSVFKSGSHIYAQVIDDTKNTTIASFSDLSIEKGTGIERANIVGQEIAKLSISKKIKDVVFDRNGFKYTGRVKALADSARSSGLSF
jgi:large subunit ribosomal protein L18